jgi:hypothetical protein
MKKMKLLYLISGAGDCFIKLNNGMEYLCTTDFSNKYIKRRRKQLGVTLNFKHTTTVLVFNWDENSFMYINPDHVVGTTPLAKILKNKP